MCEAVSVHHVHIILQRPGKGIRQSGARVTAAVNHNNGPGNRTWGH